MVNQRILSNYFSLSIVTIFSFCYSAISLGETQLKNFRDNSKQAFISKLYQTKSTNIDERNFSTRIANVDTPLYEITGSFFETPLVIHQWQFKLLPGNSHFGDTVNHRFTILSSNQIYIEQTMLYHGSAQCRIFYVNSQALFKPKTCISSDFSNTYYKKLASKYFAIWGSSEGVSEFIFAKYSAVSGQTNLINISLGYAQIENVKYVNEVLYFSSSCNVIKGCPISADIFDKLALKFKWSESTGIVKMEN